MALVKGSKVTRIKIIEYRRGILIFACFAIVLASISALFLSSYAGYKKGLGQQKQTLSDVQRLSSELAMWKKRSNEFEQLLENSKVASEVDRQASEEVRQEILELKEEVSRLNEENSFYKGIMAPNEKESGLTLGEVELVQSKSENAFEYKFVIRQLAQRHNVLSGYVSVTIRGRQDGVETFYALSQLSDSVSGERVRLRFKYFQVLSGVLTLPDGFEPEGLRVEAKTTGNNPQTIDKKFGWLVEEV